MKIAASHIQMQNQHVYQYEQNKQESLHAWIGQERPPTPVAGPDVGSAQAEGRDRLTLSETAMRHYWQQEQATRNEPTRETNETATSGEDPKFLTMRIILEALTGKRIAVSTMDSDGAMNNSGPVTTPQPGGGAAPTPTAKAGWGVEYEYHERITEHEAMSYQATGEVQTSDGASVSVGLTMDISREYTEAIDIQLRAGDAVLVDPLVINFADQAPSLSEQKFAFDLNSDGSEERISFVTPGSGFLFLDRNHDGRATEGSELFGPQGDNGFRELSSLDADHNGWLDDNDPLFAKLAVWAKDAAGSDYFASLKDLDIGAILLDHHSTPFSLNNPRNNSQLGQLTDTGIFLRENGTAGTVQEIRLAV